MSLRRFRSVLQQAHARKFYEERFIAATEIKNYACALYSTGSDFVELPRKLKRFERKPWVTDINEIKRKARVCGDVHVGDPPHKIRTCDVNGSLKNKEHPWERGGVDNVFPVVESFHLYDRLGRAVSHNERLQVDRVPAIVELCIQAGVDILEYPTRRRDFPVYRVAGRIIDFEKSFPKNDPSENDISPSGFWQKRKRSNEDQKSTDLPYSDLKGFAEQGMEALEELRSGAVRLMEKSAVHTCGYCSEVQVGPKGHRVRQWQAFKHQMRNGQHAWQEATFDDLLPPVYVWHVSRTHNSLLVDGQKRYYGKLPALVELFAQAGAEIGGNYRGMMREDVVVPSLEEEKLVV